MLDWLLIGGGVHGTHLSLALTAGLGWPRDRVRVLDPHPEPLTVWSHQTANTGMAFMRSSLVHHLDLDPYSLKRFARLPDVAAVSRFAPPYRRPSYALFQAHADHTIREHELGTLRVQGRAGGLRRLENGWRVETENGVLNARRVILAVGNTEQPCWPGWARALRTAGRRVDHLFDAGFDRSAIPEDERVAVIGGGISAAQAAAALSRRGPTLLVARHATRVHQLDADPGWLGPKHMDAFHRERSLAVRRETINGARNRGSVSPNVLRSVKRAVRLGGLARMTAEVEAADAGPLNTAHLKLRRPDGTMTTLVVDRIVLATGFETSRPGGAWLDEAVGVEELPLAPCGFPRLRASLEWAPELYAAGPLAELQLGPTARNIAGARAAAQRLPAA